MQEVRFDPRAEEEFLQAAQYYEEKEPGLGLRFVLAVKEAVRIAGSRARIHREVGVGCRKCFVSRFPYVLIFRERDELLQIIAVMHTRRQAGYWKERV